MFYCYMGTDIIGSSGQNISGYNKYTVDLLFLAAKNRPTLN